MKSKAYAATAALLLVLAACSSGFAQQNIAGYNKIVVPALSDAFVCVPFNQAIVGSYTVSAKDATSISETGTPLTAGSYSKATTGTVTDYAYYVRFTSGNASGLWMSIESNTTSQIVLDATAANSTALTKLLNLVAVGDTFRIYKHQTLGSVFPMAMYAHSGPPATNDLTHINVLIYANYVGQTAQNKLSAKTAGFTTLGGAHWTGTGVSINTPLPPETQFIVRNTSSTATFPVYTLGSAPDYSVATLVAPSGDLNIGTGYPVAAVLQTIGIAGVGRTVLVYNNTTTGENKLSSASGQYTTLGGAHWTGTLANPQTLPPSQTFTLRPPSNESGTKITFVKPY